jgi:hypothetical protein
MDYPLFLTQNYRIYNKVKLQKKIVAHSTYTQGRLFLAMKICVRLWVEEPKKGQLLQPA